MKDYKTAVVVSAILAYIIPKASATTFSLQENYVGEAFLGGFSWATGGDPAGGHVNYVDQGTALQRNLTYGKSPRLYLKSF